MQLQLLKYSCDNNKKKKIAKILHLHNLQLQLSPLQPIIVFLNAAILVQPFIPSVSAFQRMLPLNVIELVSYVWGFN